MKNKLDSLKVKQKIFEHTRSPSIKAWLLIELMDPKQIVPIVPLPNYLLSKPVRPDTGITSSPNVSKSCPNFGQLNKIKTDSYSFEQIKFELNNPDHLNYST